MVIPSRDVNAINHEMAEQIIAEIRSTLKELGCWHGHDLKSTSPMFYSEAIRCVVAKVIESEREACERIVEEAWAENQNSAVLGVKSVILRRLGERGKRLRTK